MSKTIKRVLWGLGVAALMGVTYGALVAKSPEFVAIYDRFLGGVIGAALLFGIPALIVAAVQRARQDATVEKAPNEAAAAQENRDTLRASVLNGPGKGRFGGLILAIAFAPSLLTYVTASGLLVGSSTTTNGTLNCRYLTGLSLTDAYAADIGFASGAHAHMFSQGVTLGGQLRAAIQDDEAQGSVYRPATCPTMVSQYFLVVIETKYPR